jgi:signal recognition particle GTPase
MHEIENAYSTWISSQVSMDQNVLKDVQSSLLKELIDSKSEYERYLKADRTIVMHGLLYTRVSLLQGSGVTAACQRQMKQIQQQEHCAA